ncbi:MAG: sigma 54-interacting transcriptional regulator [Acidobacteriia bacterium]|nr:sigma 54-interacting transcriptional regulator [Terriglobia bacterium]
MSRLIAGHDDIASLLSGVAESLQRIVAFDFAALILHDRGTNSMRFHVLNASEPANLRPGGWFRVDQDPAGWVWTHQQPLVVSQLEGESRWPEFMEWARAAGLYSLALVPLTAGKNRLGAFGFGCVAPFAPSHEELAFLERVASEFAVAVEAFLAKQQVVHERDRILTLFEITNALVSKLSPDDLFSAISEQLSKIIRHDSIILMLRNKETGELDLEAHHLTGTAGVSHEEESFDPEGSPSGEALASAKPVVIYKSGLERFPSSEYRKFLPQGFQTGCSVPLITSNGALGTLEVARTTDELWTEDDVALLLQVARQIAVAVENALSWRELKEMKDRLATERLYLEDEIRLEHNVGNMVGQGPAFESLLKSIQTVAATDATVLILGETGTGKELVARAVHDLSGRSKATFVKVNCAAIPGSLLESELFGHERGAFTGAIGQRIGRFELANKGTLFLDEIGEMPLELQPKLLRAIQDQEFERVGGSRTIRTDARLVAATNRDLKAMVEENRFRADLYYRLHVFPISVPPLRERPEDIPLLARFFVQHSAQRMNRRIETIPSAALEALKRYDWPGNIRELQNIIERSVSSTAGSALTVAMPEVVSETLPQAPRGKGAKVSEADEREALVRALKQAHGIVGGPNGAAARLGLKRTTLHSRMQKLNISRQYG